MQLDGHSKPICSWSLSQRDAESLYSLTHQECFTIVCMGLLIPPEFEDSDFTLQTDHAALKWILDLGVAIGKRARWLLRLSEIELDVVHHARTMYQFGVALLRLLKTEEDCNSIDDTLPVMSVNSPKKDEYKGGIKPNHIIPDCNETGANATSPGLPTLWPTMTPRVDTTTPMVMELLTEQAKDPFWRPLPSPFGTPGSCC